MFSLLSESIALKTPDIAGCRLPQPDPWDPGILQYVTDFPQVDFLLLIIKFVMKQDPLV